MEDSEAKNQKREDLYFSIEDPRLGTFKCSGCGCVRRSPSVRDQLLVQTFGIQVYICGCECHQDPFGRSYDLRSHLTEFSKRQRRHDLEELLGKGFWNDDDDPAISEGN